MELLEEDLSYCVGRLPKDVRELMEEERVFLAGGFIRSLIAGERVNDIDLWGCNAEDLGVFASRLAAGRVVDLIETGNALTIAAPGRVSVQFITRWIHDNPVDLAQSFDFTIASAVIWREGGVWRSHCHDLFYADLAAKRLRYTFPVRNEDAGGSMLRMTKFLGRGYRISPENLAGLLARLNSGVSSQDFLELEEKRQAQVYAGLLREVDPLYVAI